MPGRRIGGGYSVFPDIAYGTGILYYLSAKSLFKNHKEIKLDSMKKILFCLSLSLGALYIGKAQEFASGDNVISAGIGLGGDYGSFATSEQTPGLSLQYERGIWEIVDRDVISLGGYLGYKTYSYDAGLSDYKWTYTILGVRGAYHYNGFNINNLDVYGGAMLSYNILSFDGEGNYGSTAAGTAFLGGRWYFTESIAAMAEVGYGVAYLTIGASFKF